MQISLRGVRVHNLNGIDLELAHKKLHVVCGVSGSGKTSLALDTLYAEGQRRYLESFSTRTRQHVQMLEKADADSVTGIPPAIAVRRSHGKPRTQATIGTATEIQDFLSLLFAKTSTLFCFDCDNIVRSDTPDTIADLVAQIPAGTRVMIGFQEQVKNEPIQVLKRIIHSGFVRAVIGQKNIVMSEVTSSSDLTNELVHQEELDVVVDRVVAGKTPKERILDSITTAFRSSTGNCVLFTEQPLQQLENGNGDGGPSDSDDAICKINDTLFYRYRFSYDFRCKKCDILYPSTQPKTFSFTSGLGACPNCEGNGKVARVGADLNRSCKICEGDRYNELTLSYRIQDKNIAEISRLQIRSLRKWLANLSLGTHKESVAKPILRQIESRLTYICDVGLGYLALDQSLHELSAGERQRISLTAAMGSRLVNVLYVLDEPTAGLHPSEIGAVIQAIHLLKERGNTLVCVEHCKQMFAAADSIIEMGPAAGEHGGNVVFQGNYSEFLDSPESVTKESLIEKPLHDVSKKRRKPNQGAIQISQACGRNLNDITVDFPLGLFCLVTGVSGSGKSTLVSDTLYPAICTQLNKESVRPLKHEKLTGCDLIADAILIDQTPIGRSPKSNPATFTKAFDSIRAAFAETLDAKTHNYKIGHFSFNSTHGRCSTCNGDGFLATDMKFLSDVLIKCNDCHGTRYRKEILSVKYRGKNIAEVLQMSVRTAFQFFRGQKKIQSMLQPLLEVGLDYLRLGQPAMTLSSGEAQRLKLASHLANVKKKRTLFIIDEPTCGLHFSDIAKLEDCLQQLLSFGHSMIVVSHNLQMMHAADYIIDLGPGAADAGGNIVATGTPEQVAQAEHSLTGQCLKH